MKIKIAMIGFGNVGQGITRILHAERQTLLIDHGFDFEIVGIFGRSKGSVLAAEKGTDTSQVLKSFDSQGDLLALDGADSELTAMDIIERSGADILLEMSPTDLETGQPAIDYIKAAFKQNVHVVTCNKGPVALAMHELLELAEEKELQFLFEGSVMAGSPVINLATQNLAGAGITSFKGILNGTTNFILTRMKQGADYQAALAEAKDLGYAEADPTNDVEGYDAAAKGVILSNLLTGAETTLNDVACTGISHLTIEDIESAREKGQIIKVLVEADLCEAMPEISVGPVHLPLDDPLAAINGAMNAITFETKILGPVTISGPGAGREETGFAMLADMLQIHKMNG
jgi:homoserine dehydrogenase